MGVVADDHYKIDSRCVHCGEPCMKNVKFCKFSDTAAKRHEMDEANAAIFASAGLSFVAPKV